MDTLNLKTLPDYKTLAGNQLPIDRTVRNGFQICIQNTTREECMAYAKQLELCGFEQYAVNEICENVFYTYTSDNTSVFLSWNAFLKTARIVVHVSDNLPSRDRIVLNESDTCIPSVAQIRVMDGLSYVFQLVDGSFLVVDGGYHYDADLQELYQFLLEKSVNGRKPSICAWMFTHSHDDHIALATEFIREKAGEVEIKSFIYQFPNCAEMSTRENDEVMQQDIERLEKNIADYYPDAAIYTLHTGQTYYFKGLEIEILFTAEDIYPYQAAHYNDVSAAWRMKFDNGKTFLMLGDCFSYSCKQLADTYGDYLKSDILQLTHHGLLGGDKRLYQYIDPEVCLWTTQEDRFLGERQNDKFRYCLGEGGCDYNAWIRDESVRVRKHYHAGVTTVLNMD